LDSSLVSNKNASQKIISNGLVPGNLSQNATYDVTHKKLEAQNLKNVCWLQTGSIFWGFEQLRAQSLGELWSC